MNTVNLSVVFMDWLARLTDSVAAKRIVARIRLAENGNFGDHHFVKDGIWEMRINHGPGYRIYYTREGDTVYLLLVGGDKQSQNRDIDKAVALWTAIKESDHE